MEYIPVIGLEIHAQLRTRSKLFCACASSGGDAPNARTCPVCLGHPGALPVVNAEAVRMAVRTGLALGATRHPVSRFARKHYFYPDLPKGYQITQYDRPICTDGTLRFRLPGGAVETVALQRMHLEEDAGKLLHRESQALADYNRSGIPLLEIVTLPVLASPEAAVAFLQELRRVLMYLDVCDGNMEDASLRCDANVSLRDASGEPGQRTEIKNLNSFRHIERALHWEIDRQCALREAGLAVDSVTLLWNESESAGSVMRGKESAADYHYTDDPDLPEVLVSFKDRDAAAAALPELPLARAERFVTENGLSEYDALVLTADRSIADYYEQVLGCFPTDRRTAVARTAAHWVSGEILALIKDSNRDVIPVDAARLARLIERIEDGSISRTAAKQVFDRMCENRDDADTIITKLGLQLISDEITLRQLATRVLGIYPDEVQAYRSGKEGLLGFFVRAMMEASGGKADPRRGSAILRAMLSPGKKAGDIDTGGGTDPDPGTEHDEGAQP